MFNWVILSVTITTNFLQEYMLKVTLYPPSIDFPRFLPQLLTTPILISVSLGMTIPTHHKSGVLVLLCLAYYF